MTSKHIPRDYSAHRKSVIRPSGEYCGLEIFSYDPQYTQHYLRENNTLELGDNCKKASWRSWACYSAESNNTDMILYVDYNVREVGEYRIDLLYEQNSKLYSSQDLTGEFTILKDGGEVYHEENLLYDGEDNCIKRIPFFIELNEGVHQLKINVPPNCYFYGVLVRKIVKYTANNYFGADAGKDSGNMMFTSATLSMSDMAKPSELSLTIGYDDSYVCEESPSGFYIDYMDEVNFYIKDNDNTVRRVFGGYVSSILPNANLTELSVNCADRLVDGQNKYILDELRLQGGKEQTTNKLVKNFDTYTQILKYLCDVHETTLHSNISQNYLVEGEKYNEGFTITYGNEKTIKSVPVSNGYVSVSNNHVTLRNKPKSDKQQVWTLYDAKKHTTTAPEITNYPYLHITYGMGSPKTEVKSKTTETVDTSDTTAGSVKFNKCGVSEDKKYVMFIGKASVNETYKKYKNQIMKRIYENKCPYCGKTGVLRWDDSHGNNCIRGGNKSSVTEGEITCSHCDCDFDGVGGKEKITGSKKRLKAVTSPTKSSVAERKKLSSGKMTAVPKTGVSITSDDIFKAITKEAFKYKYKRGSASTYTQLKKTGSGDCHAFSDLIFTHLKKYGVTCKIVQYKTGASNTHQSVRYKDEKNQWVDFPYKEYGWDKKYKNMLNATSGSKTGSKVDSYKGANIGKIQVKSTSTSKSQTTQVTTTKNYDKDKPFQGYLKITYSHDKSLDAPKYNFYMKFTQSYLKDDAINVKGFPLYWVNNNTKKTTFIGSDDNSLNITDWLRQIHHDPYERIYLQSIQMIAPVRTPSKESEDVDWYKYDKSTHDESSCKMDLYQITFDDNTGSNADELSSCGKTVNSMLQDLVKKTNYLAYMTYGLHRKDDEIHFRVNNSTETSYTASEGNNNNILSWNSISYSPLSSLYNMSIQVFKQDEQNTNNYYYVDSRIPRSILEYGEQATLETSNEPISTQEAYFNARMNSKFNGDQGYTYTITVPNYPYLHLGEYVKIIANAKKLNSVKKIKSLKITFDYKKGMPRIQTEIGLDELSPDIQLRENIRNLRRNAKTESTSFSSSATPVQLEVYEWDR